MKHANLTQSLKKLTVAISASLHGPETANEAIATLGAEHRQILDMERMGMPGAAEARNAVESAFQAIFFEDHAALSTVLYNLQMRAA